MNIRKPADYSVLFSELDKLIAAQLPQMELYREIGRVVSSRAEKGAAVAASEHLQVTYPAAEGFSPRNLRRMRDFYRMYGDAPDGPVSSAFCSGVRSSKVRLNVSFARSM